MMLVSSQFTFEKSGEKFNARLMSVPKENRYFVTFYPILQKQLYHSSTIVCNSFIALIKKCLTNGISIPFKCIREINDKITEVNNAC